LIDNVDVFVRLIVFNDVVKCISLNFITNLISDIVPIPVREMIVVNTFYTIEITVLVNAAPIT
jgi:hypothetical protein